MMGKKGIHQVGDHHHSGLSWIGVFSVVTFMTACSSLVSAQENPFIGQYLTLLKQGGIAATKEELGAYLRQHHPSPLGKTPSAELIKQLGDDDFLVRETAMQKLMRATAREMSSLEAAAKSQDPEVRWRAKMVLEQTSKPKSDLLYAAFVVIHNQRIAGLTPEILGCAPVCSSDHLKQSMIRALEATAVVGDVPALRQGLIANDPTTRSAAATVFGKLLGDDAKPDLIKLLKDEDENVRLLAAEQLVKSATPEALFALGDLLDSEITVIRVRSSQILRASLKIELPYSAFAPAATRQKQAAALRDVIKQQTSK